MRKIASILIVLLLFSCQKSKKDGETIFHIEFSNFKESQIYLSEIGNQIEYIPLENQFPVGRIISYKITDNFIYASIKDVGIVRFTKDGKLDRHYGRIGNGPGEYLGYVSFTINQSTGTVYIMDYKMDDIEVYNNIGNHLRNIKLPIDDDGFGFSEIEFIGSSLFLSQTINMGRGDHDWLVLDTFGNILNEKNNPYPEFIGRTGTLSPLSKIKNNLLYWDNFKDTVFHVHPDFTYFPVCVFSKGEHKFPMSSEGYNPLDEYLKKKSDYILLYTFLETSQFFFLKYELNTIQKLAVIDKKIGIVIVTDLKNSKDGLINDLDKGLPFIPERYFEIGNEKYLVAFVQPFEIKNHVASDDFKNSTPKYPEKKKELEKLANSLDENDNPVLILVRLKN